MGGNPENSDIDTMVEIDAPTKPETSPSGFPLWKRLVLQDLILKDTNSGKLLHIICDHDLSQSYSTDDYLNASIIVMDGDEVYACYGVEHPIESRKTREGTMVSLEDRFYYVLDGKHCVLK